MRQTAGMSIVQTRAMTGDDATSAAEAVASLRASRARIIFFACYADTARMLFRTLHREGMFGPKFAFITLGWLTDGWWAEDAGGDANVTEVAAYHFTASLQTTCSTDLAESCAAFERRFQATYPETPYILHTHWAYDAVYTWARALDAAIRSNTPLYSSQGGANDPARSDLWWHLRNQSFDGVSGRVEFDAVGDRSGATVQFVVGNVQPTAGSGMWSVRHVGTYSGSLAFHAPVYFQGGRSTPPRATPAALALLMPDLDADPWQAVTCAALLAVRHINSRNGSLVPIVGAGPDDGYELRPILRATGSVVHEALFAFYSAMGNRPHAVVGPAHSRLSRTLALMTSTEESIVPMLSYWSSDTALSDMAAYPHFGRGIYTSKDTATYLAAAIRATFGWENLGVVFVGDAYGTDLASELFAACHQEQINVVIPAEFSIVGDDAAMQASIQRAVSNVIAVPRLRIFVVICFGSHILHILRAAKDGGALTAEYAWIWVDGASMLPATLTDADAALMHGTLAFEWQPPLKSIASLRTLWASATPADCATDEEPFFTPSHSIFDSPPPLTAHLIYDCVMAAGLALRAVDNPRDGLRVLSALRAQRFNGTSGPFAFDANLDRSFESEETFGFYNFVSSADANRRWVVSSADTVSVSAVRVLSAGRCRLCSEAVVWIGGGSVPPGDLLMYSETVPLTAAILASTLCVVLPLLAFVACVLCYCHRQQAKGQLMLRDRKTGLPPVLTLLPGVRYHCFLSHTWKSGQGERTIALHQCALAACCVSLVDALCGGGSVCYSSRMPGDPRCVSSLQIRRRSSSGSSSRCYGGYPSFWMWTTSMTSATSRLMFSSLCSSFASCRAATSSRSRACERCASPRAKASPSLPCMSKISPKAAPPSTTSSTRVPRVYAIPSSTTAHRSSHGCAHQRCSAHRSP